MKVTLLAICALFVAAASPALAGEAGNPKVRLKTDLGDITLLLYRDKAPITVGNFLEYVDANAYDGTIFHRVIPGFMIQAGGYTPGLEERESRETIRNEADNGLRNEKGTVAMARRNEIDSAARQFFINVADNAHLDHTSESCTRQQMKEYDEARRKGLYKPLTCENFGYAVFGEVVAGMDVVERIESVETTSRDGFASLPVEPVVIREAERVEP